ncbi:MAG: DUF2442 domain-containing protein [Pseudomonadota bacterium]
MFLHVTKVEYLRDYRLLLEFDDGTVREIDLYKELYGEVFEPLKNLDLFRQVFVNSDTNTIEWPNGADFAPEYLRQLGAEVKNRA